MDGGEGADPATHLRFIWPLPGDCGETLHLKEIASAFWSAWYALKHCHTNNLSWLRSSHLFVTVAKLFHFSYQEHHDPLVQVSLWYFIASTPLEIPCMSFYAFRGFCAGLKLRLDINFNKQHVFFSCICEKRQA